MKGKINTIETSIGVFVCLCACARVVLSDRETATREGEGRRARGVVCDVGERARARAAGARVRWNVRGFVERVSTRMSRLHRAFTRREVRCAAVGRARVARNVLGIMP